MVNITQPEPMVDYLKMVSIMRPSKNKDHHTYKEWIEEYLVGRMGLEEDAHGNFYRTIKTPDGELPTVCYTSHHDTVHHGLDEPSSQMHNLKISTDKNEDRFCSIENRKIKVTKTVETTDFDPKVKKYVKSVSTTDREIPDPKYAKSTCLGADCTSGVFLMMMMIENEVPGVYVVFNDEEIGRVGSTAMAKEIGDFDLEDEEFEGTPHILHSVSKMISFDRKDISSIITRQTCGMCCSQDFVEGLSQALSPDLVEAGYKKLIADTGGSYTDSASFYGTHITELTNLSVGYYNQHSEKESQNITFLIELGKALIKNWEQIEAIKPVGVTPTSNVGYGHSHRDWGSISRGHITSSSLAVTYNQGRGYNKDRKRVLGLNDNTSLQLMPRGHEILQSITSVAPKILQEYLTYWYDVELPLNLIEDSLPLVAEIIFESDGGYKTKTPFNGFFSEFLSSFLEDNPEDLARLWDAHVDHWGLAKEVDPVYDGLEREFFSYADSIGTDLSPIEYEA